MFGWGKKKEATPAQDGKAKPTGFFSTDFRIDQDVLTPEAALAPTFQRTVLDHVSKEAAAADHKGTALDSSLIKRNLADFQQMIPTSQLFWYGAQGFIGYQACATIAQHWLVDKACTMPAVDAARPGFEISVDDNVQIDEKVLAYVKKRNRHYRLKENLVELSRMGRVFGIRIVLPVVDYGSEELTRQALEKPFNIDGVPLGGYRGLSQIDPYWTSPMLNMKDASDPASIHFYDPTYWIINGRKIHRSHLIIMRHCEVSDLLKPSYLYGGVPLPQQIYERVYSAERTANEAPMLALTKRVTAIHTDLAQAVANEESFLKKIALWVKLRDNYAVKTLGIDEKMEQFDISLSDLDAVIMTQYQIVAAIAKVPSTKLLGTTPKGFQSTGEFEQQSYHEFLGGIQEHEMTPLIDRHHILVQKSDVAAKFPETGKFNLVVNWNPLDSPTAQELADINLKKAQTGVALSQSGAIDGADERDRIRKDKSSGYDTLSEAVPEDAGLNDVDPGALPEPKAEPDKKPEQGKQVGGNLK